MPRPSKGRQQISVLPKKQGRYTSQRIMQVEMMDEEIPQMEVVEGEVMRESPIMQKEIAELS
ncbi:35158_t:CDS:1, partial [Racocetra persica]